MSDLAPPSRFAPANPVPLAASASAVARCAGASWVAVDGPLLERLQGACADVTVDEQARVDASRDWWPLALTWATRDEAPAVAAAVARPASTEEVSAVLAVCHEANLPVTAAGGRSGVCGASVPVFGGVVLDLTGLSGIVAVDDTSLLVDVGAGTFGEDFESELRASHALTLGHWPQSMALSTVGGWLACRSAGQHSTRYGKIEDMVVGLDAVLADGTVVHTGGRAPRSAAGPDLTQLIVGSEGTLAVITSARLRVHPLPPAERRDAWTVASFAAGLEVCRRVLRRGARPAVLRLYDAVEARRNFGVEDCVLLVVDEGPEWLVDATMHVVRQECDLVGADGLGGGPVAQWLEHRNDVSALGALVQKGFVLDTIEVAARWSVLPALYDRVVDALTNVDGTLSASAHQSHAYPDGACLYFTFAGRPDPNGADGYYRRAWDEAMRVTTELGGAVSHHHGIGLNRGAVLASSMGTAFDMLVAVKQALDPRGILNPGKLGLPSPFGPPPWP